MSHDRTALHSGTDQDLVVLLADAVGGYATGTDLHTVLAAIEELLSSRESTARIVSLFSLSAINRRTESFSRTFDAIVRATIGASFTLDSVIMPTFSLNAIVLRVSSASFALDADLASGTSFKLDAVITGALDAFQADTFQNDAFD